MITATTPATVEGVEVKPGQLVDVGTLLVRMYNVDENNELSRATREFDLQLVRMLRDPSDIAVKQSLATLRAARDQAKNIVDSRTIRAEAQGYVSDVRVRPGQHVNAGEVLLAVAPKGSAQVSLVSMVPADYRPMLKDGLKMRFELDGFRYEYSDLTVTDVSAEAVGPTEVQRFLGQERADAVQLDPGAKVLVTARLPAATFTSEGQPYGYFDGLTGTAEIRVRSEPILVTLIPALRQWLP
jgi:membrane fusion protein (multidrug efflux system)